MVLSSLQMMVNPVSATVPAPTLVAQSGDTADQEQTTVHAQDARISDPKINCRVRRPTDFVSNVVKVKVVFLGLPDYKVLYISDRTMFSDFQIGT